ncbi:MAG: HEAT repeat domain-containing protein [Myxococcales bacterium]|jgi:hypothetical protein
MIRTLGVTGTLLTLLSATTRAQAPQAETARAPQAETGAAKDGATSAAKLELPWSATLSLGAPPRPAKARIEASDAGPVLRLGKLEEALPLRAVRGVQVEPVELKGPNAAAILRIDGDDGQRAGAVVVRDRRGHPRILWSGALDRRGDPGERAGHMIQVDDRTGDGHPDIVVAMHTDRARICGEDETPLHPRAVDPRSLTLRPVVLDRLAPVKPAPPRVEAVAESPGPEGPPVLRSLAVSAVSSQPGVDDPALATPVSALTDGDPNTYWSEGRGGGGRGEFVTFRWRGGGFPIRALALTPLPGGDASAEAMSVAREVTLVGDDGARVDVALPDSPEPGKRYWATFDSPLDWSCLSIVFRRTAPREGSKAGGAVLAEVEAYTDLDFGSGVDRLVAALSGSGTDASNAADLLRTLGPEVVPPVAVAFPTLSPEGRRRAMRVFVAHAANSEPARAALAGALGDEALRDEALDALLGLGDPGIALLAPRVTRPGPLGDATAVALAKHAPLRALDPILAALSSDEGSERAPLRKALVVATRRGGIPALQPIREWAADGAVAGVGGRAAVALALAGQKGMPEARALASELLETTYPQAETFEDRWRLVETARVLSGSPAVDAWLSDLAGSEERWMLRGAAIHALRARGAEQADAAARKGLGDEYPRVRMAAARSLTGRASERQALTELAEGDRWPMVRAAALDALSGIDGASAAWLAALDDRAKLVRAAAVRGLTRARARDAWPQVKARLLDDDEWPEVVTEGIAFVRAMCVQDGAGVLLSILRRGLKPDAWEPDRDVSAVAFQALLDLGGEPAKAAISAVGGRHAPPGYRAAIERTSQAKPACASDR